MAGYIICSLDGAKLETFLTQPTERLLTKLAGHISIALDYHDRDIEDDDQMASWPSEPAEMLPVLKQHFAKDNWYADFSETEKEVWESGIHDLLDEEKHFDCKCESEGVYWNVIEEAVNHFGGRKKAAHLEVAHFGTRPFKFEITNSAKRTARVWMPYHSVHLSSEVEAMWGQFKEAKGSILNSSHQEVEDDFEELTRVFENIIPQERALYVCVDT